VPPPRCGWTAEDSYPPAAIFILTRSCSLKFSASAFFFSVTRVDQGPRPFLPLLSTSYDGFLCLRTFLVYFFLCLRCGSPINLPLVPFSQTGSVKSAVPLGFFFPIIGRSAMSLGSVCFKLGESPAHSVVLGSDQEFNFLMLLPSLTL